MFVDSHCHLNFPELHSNLSQILSNMRQNQVTHALCVNVKLDDLANILALTQAHPHLFASVGVHPDYEDQPIMDLNELSALALHPKVIAIGETGLDYYRLQGDLEWQRERFRTHIRAAIAVGKPLIIHTRNAIDDTLSIMAEEGAQRVGGVMHCFTESIEAAYRAIEMGFYISISGIVTFKNATQIHQVAKETPLDKLLIETDAPYLAPVPYRGKINQPAYVRHTAEYIATLRAIPLTELATATTKNFFGLFRHAQPCT